MTSWQCQLCGCWCSEEICDCTFGTRPLLPKDAWPITPDEDGGDETAVPQPAPVVDAA